LLGDSAITSATTGYSDADWVKVIDVFLMRRTKDSSSFKNDYHMMVEAK
jgi:hypothetical protein